jgi:DNA-binding response OmpR family regulator
MRVLIVEDDETFCRFLAKVLEGKGIEVTWTTDSVKGYEISSRDPYDLYIVDVRMPVLLGTELVEALKQRNQGARVILISAFADEEIRQASSNLGVSLLSKPFSADQLLGAIEKIMPLDQVDNFH